MHRNLVTALVAAIPFPIALVAWSAKDVARPTSGMSWLAFGEGQDSALGLLSAFGSLGSALPYLVGACAASTVLGVASWRWTRNGR